MIDLDAFVVAQLISGVPPSLPASSPGPPLLPGPSPFAPAPRAASALPLAAGSSTAAKPLPEKVLKEWKKRWHLGSWSRRECWDAKATFSLTAGPGGMPEADLQFSAKPVSLAEVVRSLFDRAPGVGGGSGVVPGGGGGVGPLGQTSACAICKCSGDKECGGGRIHTIWMGKTECNRENKKKAQELCNHDSTFLSICDLDQERKDGKKCSVHHHDFACSDRETEDKCSNRQQSADSRGSARAGGNGENAECREKSGVPCPQALTVSWPSELPVPDGTLVRSKKDTDEAVAVDRGPEQKRLRKAIDDAKARGLPPPKPCSTNRENDANGFYDAHHIHPIYLGGSDDQSNLCASEMDLHRRGHPKLNNQAQNLDEYERCSYCTALLTKHPAEQEYTVSED